jgi:hypothetical protein
VAARSEALYWNPDVWDAVAGDAWRLHSDRARAPRFVVWVTLLHRETGEIRTFGSAHLVAFKTRSPANAREFRHQERRAAAWLAAGPDRVLLGDINADAGSVWTRNLRAAGTVHTPAVPTKGRTKIDHVWTAKRAPRAVHARAVAGGSDHRALVVELPPLTDPAPPVEEPMPIVAPWALWRPVSGFAGGVFTGDSRKLTLHTTETDSIPNWGWNLPGVPHFDLDPGRKIAIQRISLDRSAYTLKSPGAPYSPNMNAGQNIQVEIVARSHLIPGYSAEWYEWLGEKLLLICEQAGIPVVFPFPFTGNDGYGVNGKVRQPWNIYARTSGIMGHSHAPGNDHWDPGNLNINRLNMLEDDMPSAADVAAEVVKQLTPHMDDAARKVWAYRIGETDKKDAREFTARWWLRSSKKQSVANAREIAKLAALIAGRTDDEAEAVADKVVDQLASRLQS